MLETELLRAVRTVQGDLPVGNAYEEGRSLRLAADHDVKLDDEVRECPMCHKPMGSVEYAFDSGVSVDVCATHGVWLDAGELDALEAVADRRSDSSTPEGAARAEHVDAVRNAEPKIVSWRLPIGDVVRAFISGR